MLLFATQFESIHHASARGNISAMQIFLDINARDDERCTALHIAVRYKQPESAKWLVRSGADRTAQNKYGYTPLHLAAYYGNIEMLKILFNSVKNKKEYIEIRSLYDGTAQDIAIRYHRLDLRNIC